ncbi:hypothetical protein [uncultured Devosia sp.]|uniref:hypothetical protein n=1 Tax=uncultured Devosia sp. TaxID=211434 RepID=UPI0035C95FC0
MDLVSGFISIGLRETALQAAAIQGAFALLGIVLTGLLAVLAYSRNRAVDRHVTRLARRERTLDVQSAIRAEVRNHWHELESNGSLGTTCEDIVAKIEAGRWINPTYTPFIPQPAPSILFGAIEGDIAILDNQVIAAAIGYYRQRALVGQFAADLASDLFWSLPADRKIDMVRAYHRMIVVLKASARDLNTALEIKLRLKKSQRDLSMPAWDPSSEFPASATGSAASVRAP